MIASYKKSCAKIILAFVAAVLSVLLSVAPAGAAEYNCGTYGAGVYQENVCAATTDGGGLADTGQPIWAILIAVLLILLGTFLLYRTRKNMKVRASQNLR